MTLWRCNDLHVALGARTLFDGLDLVIEEGECVGLIGVNGSGKSTLLQIAAGVRSADRGLLEKRRGAVFALLAQEPRFDPSTTIARELFVPQGRLAEAQAEHASLARQLESAGAGEQPSLLRRLEEASDRIEQLGGWDTAHLAQAMLERLGIAESQWERPLGQLSGGTQKRVALAQQLLLRPDLLLLDEPTNHLDVESIEWLEHELDEFPGAILLVTHDRYFLDRLAERIVEIDQGRLASYPGNFQDYLLQRIARDEEAARREHKRQRLIAREIAWLRKAPEARRTKRKARVDAARKLIAQKAPAPPAVAELAVAAPPRAGHTLFELKHLTKRFGERLLIDDLSLVLERGERIGIVGPNGVGKSTLVRLILGEEPATGGEIVRAKNTRIAYFDQSRAGLDLEASVWDAAGEADVIELGGRAVAKRDFLVDLLFPVPMHRLKVRALSGGEKNRLLLGRLLVSGANLLVLDEPTNDLDITTLELLEELLVEFGGSVVLVTHDRYFLDKVATSLLVFEGAGKVTRYPGNHAMYLRLRAQRNEEAREACEQTKARPQSRQGESRTAARAGKRGLSWAEQRRLEQMEGLIELAEQEKARLEQTLAEPELYRTRGGEVAGIREQLQQSEAQIEGLYSEWQDLESRRE